jgi:Ser/Thr protein kinase RdoA (MazF antagonist)
MKKVLDNYGFVDKAYSVIKFGSGLINHTWVVEKGNEKYILQKINTAVFKTPEDIAFNIDYIEDYLKEKYPDYYFTSPFKTIDGKSMVKVDGDYYRLFSFVKGSHTIDVVKTPKQAYEAAKQFGKFTNLLSGLDVAKLKTTLPSFHDLSLRYHQFLDALKNGNPERIKETAVLIQKLKAYSGIVDVYENIKVNPEFKLRGTHHDTKISNVLLNDNDEGICVIDLDTIMPGYFISDLGDMMRTYLSPVSEEEKDFSKIKVRGEFYKAIVDGYREELKNELSEVENNYIFYSGTFMIYMQALRFLTDHLNNDVYYGAKYEGHNYVRAQNQATLLERLMEKKDVLSAPSYRVISE